MQYYSIEGLQKALTPDYTSPEYQNGILSDSTEARKQIEEYFKSLSKAPGAELLTGLVGNTIKGGEMFGRIVKQGAGGVARSVDTGIKGVAEGINQASEIYDPSTGGLRNDWRAVGNLAGGAIKAMSEALWIAPSMIIDPLADIDETKPIGEAIAYFPQFLREQSRELYGSEGEFINSINTLTPEGPLHDIGVAASDFMQGAAEPTAELAGRLAVKSGMGKVMQVADPVISQAMEPRKVKRIKLDTLTPEALEVEAKLPIEVKDQLLNKYTHDANTPDWGVKTTEDARQFLAPRFKEGGFLTKDSDGNYVVSDPEVIGFLNSYKMFIDPFKEQNRPAELNYEEPLRFDKNMSAELVKIPKNIKSTPDDLNPLYAEAKKYKTAEEFVRTVDDKVTSTAFDEGIKDAVTNLASIQKIHSNSEKEYFSKLTDIWNKAHEGTEYMPRAEDIISKLVNEKVAGVEIKNDTEAVLKKMGDLGYSKDQVESVKNQLRNFNGVVVFDGKKIKFYSTDNLSNIVTGIGAKEISEGKRGAKFFIDTRTPRMIQEYKKTISEIFDGERIDYNNLEKLPPEKQFQFAAVYDSGNKSPDELDALNFAVEKGIALKKTLTLAEKQAVGLGHLDHKVDMYYPNSDIWNKAHGENVKKRTLNTRK